MQLSEAELLHLAASLRRIERKPAPVAAEPGGLWQRFFACPKTSTTDEKEPPPPGPKRIWYQGGERYFDVFVDLDAAGEPEWFQLTFRGRTLTWERQHNRLWTGYTNEGSFQPGHSAVKLVTAERHADRSLVALVRNLLAALPQHSELASVLPHLRKATLCPS